MACCIFVTFQYRVFQSSGGLTEIRYFCHEHNLLFLTRRTNFENIDFAYTHISISNTLLDSICSATGTGNLRCMNLTFLVFQDIDALVQLLNANHKLKIMKTSQLQKLVGIVDAGDKAVRKIHSLLGHHDLRELAANLQYLIPILFCKNHHE